MRRHRQEANARRRKDGLTELGNGPRYSAEREEEQFGALISSGGVLLSSTQVNRSNGVSETHNSASQNRVQLHVEVARENGHRCSSSGCVDDEFTVCSLFKNEDEANFVQAINAVDATELDGVTRDTLDVDMAQLEELNGRSGVRIGSNWTQDSGARMESIPIQKLGRERIFEIPVHSDPALLDSQFHYDPVEPAYQQQSAYVYESGIVTLTNGDGVPRDYLFVQSSGKIFPHSAEALELPEGEHAASESNQFERGGTQASAAHRFDDWVTRNHAWIKIFLEHGFKLGAQDSILKELRAPVMARQLRRNFEKYTSFSTVNYLACRRHMLLKSVAEAVRNPELHCISCMEQGTSQDVVFFEYLPLLNTIRAWAANYKACKQVFSYHQEKLARRVAAESGQFCERSYEDFFDGNLYQRIVKECGGYEAVEYNVFIAPSTDGFQTFENHSYDCWPIAALNYNLDPSMRYLMKNIIPLGFVKGPKEPEFIDTCFTPLDQEIREINKCDGTAIKFHDGVDRKIRVHVSHPTGDKLAIKKQAGLVGHNGRCPCRFCDFAGVWSPFQNHMYYPTKCSVLIPAEDDPTGFRICKEGSRARTEAKTLSDLRNITYRSTDVTAQTLSQLGDPGISNAEHERIRKRTGIKWRTVPLSIHTIFHYTSFLLDIMHTWMKICKDIMDILKGKCIHLKKSYSCDDRFIIRPVLSQREVEEMKQLGIEFVCGFESLYYRGDVRRVGVCKSTVHDVVHLSWMVEQCGPLVNYSQFWIERFFGFIKHLLHATILPAASMNETTKMTERVKIYFGNHFVSRDGRGAGEEFREGELKLLFPCDREVLNSAYHARMETRKLLSMFISKAEGIEGSEASAAVEEDGIWCYERVSLPVGDGRQIIGACSSRRHRSQMKRSDCYIAAEFSTEHEHIRDVYYGKLLKLLRYTFRVNGHSVTKDLILADRASGFLINQYQQVLKKGTLNDAFRNTTIEDVTVILRSIRVLEHRTNRGSGRHTIFIDPQRAVNMLLHKEIAGPDGVNRNLVSLRR